MHCDRKLWNWQSLCLFEGLLPSCLVCTCTSALFLRVNGLRFLDELLLTLDEYLHMNRTPVVERVLFA